MFSINIPLLSQWTKKERHAPEVVRAFFCVHSTKCSLTNHAVRRVWNPQLVCGMELTQGVECNQSEGGYTL